jgi:hypothetical protein
MNVVSETLESLAIGQPHQFRNLSIFPLRGGQAGPRDYLTLSEAFEKGLAQISEVSEDGSVLALKFENNAKQPVLVLDGEELVGAKQDRIANVTILAPAEKTITVPVSCVEAGRWNYRDRNFKPTNRAYFSQGRRRKTAAVSESLREHGVHYANQDEIWDEVALKHMDMDIESSTGSMADLYEQQETRITDFVDAFEAEDGQVGAVFAIGPRIEGLEVFDNAETFAEMLPKLIRSYAIDAIDRVDVLKRKPALVAAQSFILSLERAEMEVYPAVGLGMDVRATAHGVVAAGLVESERVVHLVGFTAPAKTRRHDSDEEEDEDYGSRAA